MMKEVSREDILRIRKINARILAILNKESKMKIKKRFRVGWYDKSGNFGEFDTLQAAKNCAERIVREGVWQQGEDKYLLYTPLTMDRLAVFSVLTDGEKYYEERKLD